VRVSVGEVTLFFEVFGQEWVFTGSTMERRPALIGLHGGPGVDGTGLRYALARLTDVAQVVVPDQRQGLEVRRANSRTRPRTSRSHSPTPSWASLPRTCARSSKRGRRASRKRSYKRSSPRSGSRAGKKSIPASSCPLFDHLTGQCARHDSNMRPLPPQGSALSPELRARGGQCSRARAGPASSTASSGTSTRT
jgi:hypothetical protein